MVLVTPRHMGSSGIRNQTWVSCIGRLVGYSPWGCDESDTTEQLTTHMCFFQASQEALVVKNPPASTGDKRDAGPVPGLGRFPRGGHGIISILVWRNPWTEEPGGLQYIGSQRVGHD